MKDQPHTTPLDLLKVLLEQVENDALTHTRYPPSTSSWPNPAPKPAERYHQQPPADKRNDDFQVHPAQLDAEQVEMVSKTDSAFPTFNNTADTLESWYNNGFLIGLQQAAEIGEYRSGHCFNCQKEGHCWHQCKEPLSPELQELVDKQDKEWGSNRRRL